MNAPPFDDAAAHKFFAADCFNRAWELIEKPDRTREEGEQMLLLSAASMWHWMQRPDCTPTSKSIGYWQLSRIQALQGRADEARRYAEMSLDQGRDAGPFFVGYAYEALARAEQVAKNLPQARKYLIEAERHAAQVSDPQDRDLLVNDLKTIG